MDLYIVRHGIAEDLGSGQARTDAERALTKRGRERTRQVADGLAALGCRPGCVATSPLRRAEQTAAIFAEVLATDAEPETCEFLEPGADPDDLVKWLKHRGEESILVVGHMPDVSELASYLIGGDEGASIAFKKAGVCLVVFPDEPGEGAGSLLWLMQPRQIMDLGGP